MAHKPKLKPKEEGFYRCISWLEQVYKGNVLVMDIDLETCNVQLWGDPYNIQNFKDDLNVMLSGISDPYDEWRYL